MRRLPRNQWEPGCGHRAAGTRRAGSSVAMRCGGACRTVVAAGPATQHVDGIEQVRLRLVFLESIRQPSPIEAASLPSLDTTRAVPARAVSRPAGAPRTVISTTGSVQDSSLSAAELLEQGRQWAREQSPPGFEATPLRSRRAQLPGGGRADAFRMRQPLSPKQVMGFIARAFGDPGPPCPRIQANIPGLLAATSERERKLLDKGAAARS